MPFLLSLIDLSLHLDMTRACHMTALLSGVHTTQERRTMATKESIFQHSRVCLN